MSQAMLARRLVCTKGNISRLLDRMEAKRLLRRRPDPGDRRRVLVEATDHGSRAFEAALAILETITGTLRSLYSDDELFQLVRLLSRMAEALGLSLEDRFPASKGA